MSGIYRVMLGRRSVHAAACFAGSFIGTDFGFAKDLTNQLPEQWRDFNTRFIPVFLNAHPEKSRISAGLACGALWTVSKGIQAGDLVLCPDGAGNYRVGEVIGHYWYASSDVLPHRRKVRWLDVSIPRSAMSEALQNSSGSIGTVCDLGTYADEIRRLMGLAVPATIAAADPVIEDPVAFAMEKHLEAFLVANWAQTELAKDFAIFEEDGEPVGQQYATDAGPIDILAISHDRKRVLVVELKRGRASDVVVGQILRYMGYVKEQVAEPDQTVEGVIIALENDQKLRWALAAVPNIRFYRYQVSFKLLPA